MDEHPLDEPRNNGPIDSPIDGVERFRPVRPERPDDDSAAPLRGRSSLPLVMAGGGLLLGIAVLAVLAAPIAGVMLGVIGVVLLLTALAAFHYVVWGWWLGGAIREEVEAEERAEQEAERQSQGYSRDGKPPRSE